MADDPAMEAAPITVPTTPDDTLSRLQTAASAAPPVTTAPLASDVLAGIQAAAAAAPPVQTIDPQLNTKLEFNQHMGTLHRILDRVGSALGGGENLSITKDAQGNVSVQHTPLTTGEKWARVAAAALGGGAAGAAAATGPMGIPRAIGAGMNFGMNLQSQANQRVLEQASAEQKLATAKQNNILNNQRAVQMALQTQGLQMQLGDQERSIFESSLNKLTSGEGAKDYGVVNSMDDLMRIVRTNPDVVGDHAQGNVTTALMPNGQGGWQVHVVQADPNDADRMTRKGDMMSVFSVDPATGKPELKQVPAALNQKYGDVLTKWNPAQELKFAQAMAAWTKANRPSAMAEHPVSSYSAAMGRVTQLQGALQGETDPAKQAQIQGEIDRYSQLARRLETFELSKPAGFMATQGGRVVQVTRGGEQQELRGVVGRAPTVKSGEEILNQPAEAWGQYDPSFPPAQNFERGTMGIVPKQIGKVPASVTKNADLARNIAENANAANEILNRRSDIFGPFQGRFTSLQQMAGSDDPDIQNLRQSFSNIARATVNIHGARGQSTLQQEEEILFNHWKNGRAAIQGALQADVRSSQTWINSERNFETYGTATGPDRAQDRNRPANYRGTTAPAAAPAAPAAPGAAPARPAGVGPDWTFKNGSKGQGWYRPGTN